MENSSAYKYTTIPVALATASGEKTNSMTNINRYLHGPDIPWNHLETSRWYDPSAVIGQFELEYNKATEKGLPVSYPQDQVCPSTSSTAPHASFAGDVHRPGSVATPSSESIRRGTSIPSIKSPNGKTSSHRSRKKMDIQAKESYKQMRELRPCDKCRKGKRKCDPSHPRPAHSVSDRQSLLSESESISETVLHCATSELLEIVNGVGLD